MWWLGLSGTRGGTRSRPPTRLSGEGLPAGDSPCWVLAGAQRFWLPGAMAGAAEAITKH